MISPIQIVTSILLVTAFLNCPSAGFTQEKNAKKDGNAEALNDRGVPDAPIPPAPAPALAPARTTVRSHVQQSIVNGVRSITATEGSEKIEITDKSGKDIHLKHTRIVGGKSETTEYQAADSDALKLKSPAAALLYERYTGRPAVPRPVGGRIPMPVVVRVPGQRAPFFGGELEQLNVGPRRIRVNHGDRRIEIYDGGDSPIRVKIIKFVDGSEKVEEFSGENLQQFKMSHADVYPLYEKYTGLKAE